MSFRYQKILPSPLGNLYAVASEAGICELKFINSDDSSFIATTNHHLDLLEQELASYFSKKIKNFTVSLDPQGTDFQKKVWRNLHEIPFGKFRSYKEQSLSMNQPLAIRAIAAANGKNPIAIVIPCHRVIGTDGSLTGYSGGLEKKKWLLQHEGILQSVELF